MIKVGASSSVMVSQLEVANLQEWVRVSLGASIKKKGVAHGVMVIVGGNRQGDSSSNPGREWLHFT